VAFFIRLLRKKLYIYSATRMKLPVYLKAKFKEIHKTKE